MRPTIRTLAVALTLGTLGLGAAFAQTTGAGNNPAHRGSGGDTFFYGPLNTKSPSTTGLGNDLIKRPKGNAGAVTPVPEPSQWAMMLAGLALVGVIVKRRNNAR